MGRNLIDKPNCCIIAKEKEKQGGWMELQFMFARDITRRHFWICFEPLLWAMLE